MNRSAADIAAYQLYLAVQSKALLLRREAEVLQGAGAHRQAKEKLEASVSIDGGCETAWHDLANLYFLLGSHDQALYAALHCVELQPTDAEWHYSLGRILRQIGGDSGTLQKYRTIVSAYLPALHASLEEMCNPQGTRDFLAAGRVTAQVLRELTPASDQEGLVLGNVLMMLQDVQGAIAIYRATVTLSADDPHLIRNLGIALGHADQQIAASKHLGHAAFLLGRYRKAVFHLETVRSTPDADATVYTMLAFSYQKLSRHADRVRVCREGSERYPDNTDLHVHLALALVDCGYTREAMDVATAAASRLPRNLSLKMQERLTFPILCQTESECKEHVRDYTAGLETLLRDLVLDTPEAAAEALQGLSIRRRRDPCYHDIDVLSLQNLNGKLVHRIMAASYPDWVKPRPRHSRDDPRRIRIGYVSGYMGAAAGSLWLLGWLEHHSRTDFECYAYHLAPSSDPLTNTFRCLADVFRQIPNDLDAASKSIVNDDLDILIWTDIEASPITTMMAGLRLAPVQCAGWGYPYTSGMPTMDYYLSSDLMEPMGAASHYSEKLIRLPGIGVTYPRPVLPSLTDPRSFLGLPEGAIAYFSLQAISKYQPKYDYVYPAIAECLPKARFVFLSYPAEAVMDCFQDRLRKSFAIRNLDSQDYCSFVADLTDWNKYIQRTAAADVVLDTFVWSGCLTTLEAFACGVPVVTCPGRFRRGRQSYGMLQKLGVTEIIAKDESEYVEIAVRLGRDEQWRQAIKDKIRSRLPGLFDDMECLKAVEEFYRRVART